MELSSGLLRTALSQGSDLLGSGSSADVILCTYTDGSEAAPASEGEGGGQCGQFVGDLDDNNEVSTGDKCGGSGIGSGDNGLDIGDSGGGCGSGGSACLVAVKRFRSDLKGKRGIHLLRREAALLSAAQSHPHVVGLLDAFVSDSGRPYLVTEYVPRCVASELRTRGPGGLSSDEVKLLAWQLARALKHLHDNKIIHRDIKPANLLLDDAGVLKLCDFGSASFLSPSLAPRGLESAATEKTSRWYRAPELVTSNHCGAPADVWSFGCTVAELVSGRPLLPGCSDGDQMMRIMKFCGLPPYDPYSFLRAKLASDSNGLTAAVSPQLLTMLEACLRLDPKDRPTANKILAMPYFRDVYELIEGTVLDPIHPMQSGSTISCS